MRDILFRGKRLDNGEWVEGFLLKDTSFYGKPENHVYIVNHEHPSGCFGSDIFIEINPDTVGQYTGLTDKNGKKIFDGDILKGDEYPYKSSDGTYNYYAEVVWFDDSPAFGLYTFKSPQSKVRGISSGLSDYIEDFAPCMWEVIGNIHDNPELMEATT